MIRRYFIGYFGDKPIDAVTEADLERYAEWRRTYWTEGPGKLVLHIEYERDGHRLRRPVRRSAPSLSRQRGETVVLRGLLRWAARQGYLKTPPEISIKARRSPDNRRPSFEPHEFARLEAVSLSRLVDPIMDGTGAEVRASDRRSWRDRPPRGGPSSKLVQGRPLLHGSLGRRSRPVERSRPSGEGRHEHLRGRWSVAERGVRAHAVVV
ncbi:hypothetical protein LFADAHJC_LOCUS2052 [Methylorubrum extorquens]